MRHEVEGNGLELASVSEPGRRRILAMGLGVAVPLVAGVAPALAATAGRSSPFAAPLAGADADEGRVFEHLAGELWRTAHDIHAERGIHGEHVRRFASHLDLFAVQIAAARIDKQGDGRLRREVTTIGREAAVQRVIEGLSDSHEALGSAKLGRFIDEAAAAHAVEQIMAKGCVGALRSHRAGLERLAGRFDRGRAGGPFKVMPAVSGQKPGDDFLGYPEPPPLSNCDMLRALGASLGVMAVFAEFFPYCGKVIEAAAAIVGAVLLYACTVD